MTNVPPVPKGSHQEALVKERARATESGMNATLGCCSFLPKGAEDLVECSRARKEKMLVIPHCHGWWGQKTQ